MNFEQRLQQYEIDLKFFTKDDREADIMVINREKLQEMISEATKDQLDRLSSADKKAVLLYEENKNAKTEALFFLEEIVLLGQRAIAA